MHVLRVVRVLVVVLIGLVLVAGLTSVFTARPDLQTAKRNVDKTWTTLQADVAAHDRLLGQANDQLRKEQGPIRDLVTDVDAALGRWNSATHGGSVATQVRAANDLEELGRRLVAAARHSPRVAADVAAKQAVDQYAADPDFAKATLTTSVAYNKAVAAYEHERRGPVRSLVAKLLRDDEIPAFAPAPAPPQ
jgi:hypothetical protein